MATKILRVQILPDLNIEDVPLGIDVRDDQGNIIGKLIRYFPVTGHADLEVDSNYDGIAPDMHHIFSSRGL